MKNHRTPEELADHALAVLKKNADAGKAAQGQKYFKEKVSILGFSAADLRKTARDLYYSIKPTWTLKEVTAFCELMLPNPYLEAKAIAIFLLERYIKSMDRNHLLAIKKWILHDYCASWATVDHIAPSVVSPLMEMYPDLMDEVIGWADSENRWLRRASAVSFIKHARKGKSIRRVHTIAKKLFSDEDDLIQKANGWLLRESGKTDMKRLENFLLDNGKKIPRTTLRYAIERFPEKKRKQILAKTRQH